jgi:hypothetical protein
MNQNDDTSPKPVAANDIVADAKTWLADIGGERLQTHSENCHQWHPECLVGKLIKEIERLRLLVPPIAGTVNEKTGMDFVPWSVAASTSHASYYSAPVLPKGFAPIRIDGWIQVSDRLPPDGEYVLWWNPKDDYLKYRLAARDGNGLDWGGDLLEPIAAFTHWRHLPGSPTTIVK